MKQPKDSLPRYDLESLQLFVAVAEEQNITRAALRQHMVLSAASKRISDLEDTVGSSLLNRHARGVTLTAAGQSLLHYARQVIQTLHRMRAELSEYAKGVKGQVRMYANTSSITQFLPTELHSFAIAHPEIRIDLEERVGPAIVRAVCEGAADLGIVTTSTPTLDLQVYPYHSDRLVVVVPKGHPLAHRKSVRFSETLDFDFVGPHVDSALQYLLAQAAAAAGRQLKLRIRVSSFDGMCRMVGANMGVSVLPAMAIAPEARSLEIKRIALDDPWALRQMQVCVRDLASLPLAARQLVEHLLAAATASPRSLRR